MKYRFSLEKRAQNELCGLIPKVLTGHDENKIKGINQSLKEE